MDKDQVIKNLEEIILEELPEIGNVDFNASIVSQYGINSVSIIRIIVAVEKKFDVEFNDYELDLNAYDTFSDLVATVSEKI